MIQAQKMSDSSYNFKKLSAKLPIVHASTLSGKLYAIRVRVFREQNKIIENIFRSKLEAQIESKEKPFYWFTKHQSTLFLKRVRVIW